MIDGNRRGYQIGAAISDVLGVPDTPLDAVHKLAVDTLAFLRAAHFAHLVPEDEFIECFIAGFQQQRTLHDARENTQLSRQ